MGERGGKGRGESGREKEGSMKFTFGEAVAEVDARLKMALTWTCYYHYLFSVSQSHDVRSFLLFLVLLRMKLMTEVLFGLELK